MKTKLTKLNLNSVFTDVNYFNQCDIAENFEAQENEETNLLSHFTQKMKSNQITSKLTNYGKGFIKNLTQSNHQVNN